MRGTACDASWHVGLQRSEDEERGLFRVEKTVVDRCEKTFCTVGTSLDAFSVRRCAGLPTRGVLRHIGADGSR